MECLAWLLVAQDVYRSLLVEFGLRDFPTNRGLALAVVRGVILDPFKWCDDTRPLIDSVHASTWWNITMAEITEAHRATVALGVYDA